MAELNIVLLEPEIPQNTGNIGRTCMALNAHLHLIHPLGFTLEEKALRRAGLDYWKDLTLSEWKNYEDFYETNKEQNLYFITTKAPRNHTALKLAGESYFIFGKESRGIPEEILKAHGPRCLRIPMSSQIRSLNLSNAVAVMAYEHARQHNFSELEEIGALHRGGSLL